MSPVSLLAGILVNPDERNILVVRQNQVVDGNRQGLPCDRGYA